MRYKVAYGILLAALLAVSGSIMRQYAKADAALVLPFYQSQPNVTMDELLASRKAFVDIAHKSSDPSTYYSTVLPGLRAISRNAQLMILRSPSRDVSVMQYERIVTSTTGFGGVISNVHEIYNSRFGRDRMAEIAPQHWAALERDEKQQPSEPGGPYWLRWYLISLMLASAFFAFRIKERGLALWMEALQPYRFAFAVVGWPVFMWKYPRHTPQSQLRWALRYATLVLGTLLSGGVGAAKASERTDGGKKQDPKRKWALVVRGITSRQVSEGPPNPEYGFRWHLVAPNGTFLEEASTYRKGFSSHTPILGQMFWRQGSSTAAVVAGGTFASSGSRSVFAGTEVTLSHPRWQVAMPLCLIERQLVPTPQTSFAFLVQAVGKRGRWSAGPEFSLRTSPGIRPSWSAGAVIAYGWGRGKPTLENGAFLTHSGAYRARSRLINAWAF